MTRVLVVDDSAIDRHLAGRILEKLGDVEVFYAEDGVRGLEQVDAHVPDLVLTDMQMPELDGFGLVEAMRKKFPLIPVVLMTAAGSEEIAVRALQSGASSYVPKKCLAEDLAEVVRRVLTISQTQRKQARILNRIKRSDTEFEIENDRDLVLSLSSHLQQNFSAMRICGDADCMRVGVALEEALLNAFYHGNLEVSSKLREADHQDFLDLAQERCKRAPYKDRRISVSASFSRSEATFVIRDEGPGFDISTLPDPTSPECIERPHGRGLMLMRTFMNEVTYNAIGNQVRMVKRATRDDSDVEPLAEASCSTT